MQAAHLIGRSNKATRYDVDNAIALCTYCHFHFDGAGREEFRELMIKRLGKKGFENLIKRGRSIKKESKAVAEALVWLAPWYGMFNKKIT